jgi:hypothetical protein
MEAAGITGVLSPQHRQLYPFKQNTFFERIRAAQFVVHHVVIAAADSILKKADHAATDPLGMLAALYDVLPVQIKFSVFDRLEEDDETGIFYIATSQAIASANVLLVQLKELLLAHGTTLHKVLNEPLKSLLSPQGMRDLEEFAAADEVPYSTYGEIVQPSSGPKWISFPKPVTAIGDGRLAKLALLAGARPTNNNSVESRWSLLTNRYHAMVRRSGARYMSDIFRKEDPKHSNLRPLMETDEFLDTLRESRRFMREKEDSFKAIYQSNQEESHRKIRAQVKPLDHYVESNIGNLANKEDSGEIKPMGKGPTKRKRGKRMTRCEEAESERSSESEQTEPDLDDENSESSNSDVDASETDDRPEEDDGDCDVSEMQASDSPAVNSLGLDNVDPMDVTAMAKIRDYGCDGNGEDPSSSASPETDRGNHDGGVQADTAVITNDRGSPGASELEYSLQLSPRLESRTSAGIEGTDERIDSDPTLPQSGQSTDDTERGKSSKQDEDSSDQETDLPCGYFEQSEEDDEDVCKNIDHPFPNPRELSASDASKASRWALDYIWYLVKNKQWTDTEVTGPANSKTKNPVLILKRLDGETFPLAKCANVFYVLYGDSGLELINIEELAFKKLAIETDNEMHSLFVRKQPEDQWCVQYTRCLRTEKAMECSTKSDHVGPNANGVHRPTSKGQKSLRKLLQKNKDSRLIFHRGDLPFETAAKNIVGFVGWDSAVSSAADSDFKDVLKSISANLSQRNTSFKVSRPAEMDWVYCGDDFSEKKPRE